MRAKLRTDWSDAVFSLGVCDLGIFLALSNPFCITQFLYFLRLKYCLYSSSCSSNQSSRPVHSNQSSRPVVLQINLLDILISILSLRTPGLPLTLGLSCSLPFYIVTCKYLCSDLSTVSLYMSIHLYTIFLIYTG